MFLIYFILNLYIYFELFSIKMVALVLQFIIFWMLIEI